MHKIVNIIGYYKAIEKEIFKNKKLEEPFFDEIYKIFSAIENKKVIGYLCASSIDTIYYC
ncbi:hypothetical protein [Lebetimonas sp. JH292]|uniref:hypothetical protein n=1 Tax=Lebetimonas sp. JH292 TaxID=990068 RepID=UPI0012EC552E|nr:hypothetical protein [Lebetimonas sp. JH292]